MAAFKSLGRCFRLLSTHFTHDVSRALRFACHIFTLFMCSLDALFVTVTIECDQVFLSIHNTSCCEFRAVAREHRLHRSVRALARYLRHIPMHSSVSKPAAVRYDHIVLLDDRLDYFAVRSTRKCKLFHSMKDL
jgi:hypothetical protein